MESRELYHIGVKRRSGRYPWGSGKRPYQSGGGPSAEAKKKRPVFSIAKKKKSADGKSSSENLIVTKTVPKVKGKTDVGSKSPKDMTDAELRDAINRIRMEQEYARLFPKKQSAGKRAAEAVWNKILMPTLVDVGKQYLKKKMLEGLGLKEVKVTKKNSDGKEEVVSELLGLGSGGKKKKKPKK